MQISFASIATLASSIDNEKNYQETRQVHQKQAHLKLSRKTSIINSILSSRSNRLIPPLTSPPGDLVTPTRYAGLKIIIHCKMIEIIYIQTIEQCISNLWVTNLLFDFILKHKKNTLSHYNTLRIILFFFIDMYADYDKLMLSSVAIGHNREARGQL